MHELIVILDLLTWRVMLMLLVVGNNATIG